MGFNNFHQDLAQSEVGVTTLVNHLRAKGATEVELCNTKAYDVAYRNSLNQTVTIEVKEDFLWQRTGNVAVEYMQRGKPTGISSSTADYYVYKLANAFYSIKRESLQAKLRESLDAQETRKKTTWDGSKEIKLLLVPATVFTGWCRQII